jgi:spore germination cell wall hydrolase CwlJ-like protein
MTELDRRRSGWLRLAALGFLAAAPGVASAQDDTLEPPTMSNPLAPPPGFATPPPADLPVAVGFGDRGRALDCMSMAIAYEAAGQPVAGQQAVGQVILNRLRAARFPKTVCGVVFQGSERVTGCQFTFTCDGSFRRRLADTTLITARSIAETVLDGVAPDRVAGATHYHADYVLPYWAASGQRVARIGAHIFYRMPGDGGQVGHRPGSRLALVASAPPHAMFAPWGLPVAAAPR